MKPANAAIATGLQMQCDPSVSVHRLKRTHCDEGSGATSSVVILTTIAFSLWMTNRYQPVHQRGRTEMRKRDRMKVKMNAIDEEVGESEDQESEDVAAVDRAREDVGFTLVELLVVVVIMGVLATVSVLGVRGLTDRGQESACESDRRVIEVAVETWFADESLATSGTLTEAGLVSAQLLRDESTLYDVLADGTVVPVENGACDQA